MEELTKNNNINILIMSLSKLNSKNQNSLLSFCYEGKEYKDSYTGQLEPVPMFLSEILNEKNEKIDYIFALSTNSNKINDLFDNTKSTNDFYKDKFTRYFGDEIDSRFIIIDSEDENENSILDDALNELVSYIHKFIYPNIYLDIHGGLRESNLVLDAIVTLLKKENYNIVDAYNSKNNSSPFIFRSVKKELEIFDLVSGITEFTSYGKSKNLTDYIRRINNESKLADAIDEASDAIQLCSVIAFEKSLDKLSIELENDENKSGLIGSIIEIIRKEYSELLEKENRVIRKEIAWCIKKDFIQQALTFCEAKTVHALYNNHILCTNYAETEEIEDKNEKMIKKYNDYVNGRIFSKVNSDNNEEDKEVKKKRKNNYYKPFDEEKGSFSSFEDNFYIHLNSIKDNKEETIKYVKEEISKDIDPNHTTKLLRICPKNFISKSLYDEGFIYNYFMPFIYVQLNLKKIRNNVSHSSEFKLTKNRTQTWINIYLILLEDLIDKSKPLLDKNDESNYQKLISNSNKNISIETIETVKDTSKTNIVNKTPSIKKKVVNKPKINEIYDFEYNNTSKKGKVTGYVLCGNKKYCSFISKVNVTKEIKDGDVFKVKVVGYDKQYECVFID